MQTNKVNNLIFNLFTSYNNSNSNIKHYYIVKKHSKKVKHIKLNTNSLSNIYNNLFKHYKCSKQQLNTIQHIYSTYCYKQTTYAYNLAQRKQIKIACASM